VPDEKHMKGTAGELTVARHFVELGYYVYSPVVYQSGPIDIIAINDNGELLLLDAKTESTRADGSRIARVRTPIQKEFGVQIAYTDTNNVDLVPDITKFNIKRRLQFYQ
jgi:hypothetical protein